jgi:hypothetical protein
MHPHLGFSLPIRRMSSRTSSLIDGLPPEEIRPKVHFLRTKSRCHRRSVCGLTRNDDHRARGSNLPSAAMNNRSWRRSSRSADLALEDHQLLAKNRQLDVAVQIVRGAGNQPHHTAQQEIQQSEQHVEPSTTMKEGRSYELAGRGADRMLCVPFGPQALDGERYG